MAMTDTDMVGRRFGHWIVLGPAPKGNHGHIQWQCRCDCGAVKLVTQSHLVSGWSKSCGCRRVVNFRDLTGQRFGRLVVTERGPNGSNRATRWFCQCDCGGNTLAEGNALKNGHTTSCGCARINALTTHGKTKTPEYRAWTSMRCRCYRTRDISYPRYGALGIRVCDRWLHSFENFLADMGERPGTGYSLDRIDSKGDYCPENCRWATSSTQARNRRSSRFVSFNGRTQTVSEWAREQGFLPGLIHGRLRRGWSIADALTLPPGAPRTG